MSRQLTGLSASRRRTVKSLAAVLAALAATCGVLLLGAWQHHQLEKLHGALSEIKLATLKYQVDTGAFATEFGEYLNAGYLAAVSRSPETGQPLELVSVNSPNWRGCFSYLLTEVRGRQADSIVVGYTAAPSAAEVIWAKVAHLFIDGSSARYYYTYPKLPTSTQPSLEWTGGDCGNCQQYIARGLSPAEAYELLCRDNDLETIYDPRLVEQNSGTQ